jgi:antitoxin VapB
MHKSKAKLFTHGGSQAVRLPKEFRFEGDEVEVSREGDSVVLRPARRSPADLWREIDERRGNERLSYPVQAVLEDPSYDFDR